MKKVFNLQDLDCANCAAKMQDAGSKVEGVKSLNINFMTQKMKLEADDDVFEEVLEKVIQVIKRVEPDCTVIR